jgi:hypothetical protein
LLAGGQDPLLPFVEKYSGLLTSLKIRHQYAVAPGAPPLRRNHRAGAI